MTAAMGAETGGPVRRRRDLIVAAAVLLLAGSLFSRLILRMPPEVGQFSKYPNAALQHLHGTAVPERLLDFSPLYLGLQIAAFRFLAQPLAWIAWSQIVLLSLTAALLFLLLRRPFGCLLSLIGVTAFVLGKSVVIYGYVFEPEALLIFFLTALVFFADRDTLPGAATAGICLSLCVLTRPSFLPLAAVIPACYWLRSSSRRRFLLATLLFLLPVLVGTAFLAARNQRALGSPSLLVMSPGTVIFDGNSPLASGGGAAYPPVVSGMSDIYPDESDYQHAVYRLFARKTSGRNLTPGEANRFWATKTANYIRDYPGRFIALTARRAFYLFHGYRWDDLRISWAAAHALEAGKVPFVPFALVSALGLLGLAVGLGSWRAYFLPYAVFINQAGFMVFVYATDRQRVSLYPFFVFFAIVALSHLRTAGWKGRGSTLALLSLLSLSLTIKSDLMRDHRHIWEGFSRLRPLVADAMRDRDLLDFSGARRNAARALALGPWMAAAWRPARLPADPGELAGSAAEELASLSPDDASTQLDRALLLIEAGRLDEAEAILAALESEGDIFQRLNGRIPYPSFHLGRIAAIRGQHDAAVRHLRRALESSPGDPETLAHLACLSDDAKYAERIFRYFDDLDALFILGRACLENSRPERATAYLERLSVMLPEYQPGRIFLAAALGAVGQDTRATGVYLSAVEDRPETVLLEERILPIFKRWARAGSPEAIYRYGVVLREYGHFPEAARAFAIAQDAGIPSAGGELRNLQEIMERVAR